MRFTSFRRLILPALAALFTASSAMAQSPGVSIQFHNNGTVTVQAQNAPLRTILQEWARAGKTTFVNAERVTGGPMTIELANVSERDALATLLRGTSGYFVGARQTATTGVSSFDRIVLLPPSAVPPTARVVSNAPSPTPPPPSPIAFIPGDPGEEALLNGRQLTPAQLQQQVNARAAAAQNQNIDPPQNQPNAAPAPANRPATTPANPFLQGPSGAPGVVAPVPQQNRNPLRPNGDPEP